MVDYNKQLVSALGEILPTHHELVLHSGLETPCISYQEINNYAVETGDTLGYSRLVYRIKVWGNRIADLQSYAGMIDAALRPIGFKRTSTNELGDKNSTMIQKIMTYEAQALEDF